MRQDVHESTFIERDIPDDPPIHPAANAMPRMSESELEELTEDVRKNGLLQAIELYDDQVIDGRHRLWACKRAGVEPLFVEVDLGSQSPAEYVWSLNGLRRHLTASQKAAIATELEPHFASHAKLRQSTMNNRGDSGALPEIFPEARKGEAREHAAERMGVNPRYVSDAKTVKQESPELFEEVKNGAKTLPEAKLELKRSKHRAEMEEMLAKVNIDPRADYRVLHGDCDELLGHYEGQARLIFAEPPSDGELEEPWSSLDYLDWCHGWMSKCERALTDDGSLWLLVDHEYVEYLATSLNQLGLERRAWITWQHGRGTDVANNFNRASRAILYYVKHPTRFVFHADAAARDDVWTIPRLAKTCAERLPDFPTQLPLELVTNIVSCASDPGDLVIDPFSGSGTTGVASKLLKRRFLGMEREERWWEASMVRIATTRVT